MKRIAILFTAIFVNISILLAQAPPQGINYQAVVYSDNGNNQPGLNVPGQVLRNKSIRVRFTLIQNSANGTEVYKEVHTTTTDAFGMFSLVIGEGIQQGNATFSSINWSTGKHFLKVEIDKNGTTNFVTMSNQQLLSVPYALYSDKASYATSSGNGISSVSDNGNGTLTFTYFDGSTYTTPILTGLQGPIGATGPQGPAGNQGVAGNNGLNGLSAYDIWLSLGNLGTEQDFINSLTGPQGPAGNTLTDGTSNSQILYWNGTSWTSLDPGTNGQVLTMCNGVLTWTSGGICPGAISSIHCSAATISGELRAGFSANGITSIVTYTGGNGGTYNSQTINSSGVTGLIATLNSSVFNNGSGSLALMISGTPNSSGIASFNLNIGGQSCNLNFVVEEALVIGSNYLGGVVAYILQPSDPGYDPNTPHGLIAAPFDQGGAAWGCGATFISTSQAYGDGASNTTTIVNECWELGIAAKICSNLVLNNFDDWCLPSQNELQKLYDNRNAIGGFTTTYYWSSTGSGTSNARATSFFSGLTSGMTKNNTYGIRAIRYF